MTVTERPGTSSGPPRFSPRGDMALLGLLRHAGTGSVAALVLVSVLQVAAPLAVAYVLGALAGLLVDGAAATAFDHALGPLLALAVMMLLTQASSALEKPLRDRVTRQVDGRVRHRVRRIALDAATPAELAEQSVQDDLELVTKGYSHHTAGAAATAQLALCFRRAATVAAAAALAVFSWWIALPALVLVLAQNALLRRQWAGTGGIRTLALRTQPLQRRADHLADTVTGARAAKEIRIFGLAGWFVSEYERVALARFTPLWSKRMRVMGEQWIVLGMSALTAVPVFVLIAMAAARGELTAAELLFHLRVALLLLAGSALGLEPFVVDYGKVSAAAYRRLLDRFGRRAPATVPGGTVEAAPAAIRRTDTVATAPPMIRFTDVGFGYPNGDRQVLDGLNLEIRAGEKLAIVGLNGAGKSTLVRLLTGLQSPQRGRITADGADIAALGLPAWWARLAVVFQSPVRYHLSAEDNVRLGNGALNDPEIADRTLREALDQAEARELVEALPDGLSSVLSAGYRGGTDLSGGQWQKIALARAFYAAGSGASVVVLDEPTAHLDVKAELGVFRKLIEATADRTLVLISHRFATVRHADRIAVLSGGRVGELGTHEELLARGGDYARWYHLQAALVHGRVS